MFGGICDRAAAMPKRSHRRQPPQIPLAVGISLYSQWPTCLFTDKSYTLSS